MVKPSEKGFFPQTAKVFGEMGGSEGGWLSRCEQTNVSFPWKVFFKE
jgi:hypothetical protein